MKKPMLIGIHGTKGSGKNTVARFIAEWAQEKGMVAVDRGFADKLKWAMARLFYPDIPMRDAIDWADRIKREQSTGHPGWEVKISKGYVDHVVITGRELFQHGGTEMGRDLFGTDFWVDQLLPRERRGNLYGWVDSFRGSGPLDIATISDLRFENEAMRVIGLGGMVWHIKRPGREPDGHASEVGLDDSIVNRVIHNNGDLVDLRLKVKGAMEAVAK